MELLVGTNVDLISPFPPQEIKRGYGWMHCYRTITASDDSPKSLEQFEEFNRAYLPLCKTFGIIDKNHVTNSKHEAPLVGILIFEPAGLRNGYFHVATSRKAWGTGLVEEASQLAFKYIFDNAPTLTRVSACIFEKNYPARSLVRRLGFKQEGTLEDMILQEGEPKNMVHYGLTRRGWEKCLGAQ